MCLVPEPFSFFSSALFMFFSALKFVLCCKCHSYFSPRFKPLAAARLCGNKRMLNRDNLADRTQESVLFFFLFSFVTSDISNVS